MNKGEKEKCQEAKDKCIDEIYKIITEVSYDECNRLTTEYLNSHGTSERIQDFLISLVI